MKLLAAMICLVYLALLCTAPAHAYLDPGTGSMIFQAVIGAALAAAATGKLWWSKVKGMFGNKSEKKSGDNDKL